MPETVPGRLLVVDDNRIDRMLLVFGLEQEGHTVISAEDGRAALEMLRAEPFDLVLLDIEMPVMNGFQVLAEFKKSSALSNIPVIMVSAMGELDSVVKCIEMGAEDYLTKPPEPVLLRARVNASLEKKRLRDQQRKLFRTFATSQVAEELLEKGFSLGGKSISASTMFTDIRDFTAISESQAPDETIELLNNYFDRMFKAINGHGGIVSLIQGDGLMAVFGAPLLAADHCEQAVRAALEMRETLADFNRQQAERGKVQIRFGVGIASGPMVAGYAGTHDRATYTCVGDTVNQAARLEAYTKIALKPILVDETTRLALPPNISVEALGPVLLKGKTTETNIYAVTTPGQ